MRSLPVGWELKRLGEISDVLGGKRLPKGESLAKSAVGNPYIRVTDMKESGIDLSDIHYVSEEVAPRIRRYRVNSGDLYVVVVGATIGKCGMIPPELDNANLTENANRITNIAVDRNYLLNVLRSRYFQSAIERLRTQNAQPKLALMRLRDFPIPVPPLLEQRRIARLLGTWDEATARVAQLIAALQLRRKGLMQRLLTERVRFPEFDEPWQEYRLQQLVTISYGKSPNGIQDDCGSFAIYGTSGLVGRTNRFLCNGPAVIIGRKGTIDKPLLVERPFWAIDTTFYCVPNPDVDIGWLYYALSNIELSVYNEASGVPSLSRNTLNSIPFRVPGLREQQRIAKVLRTCDEELTLCDKKLSTLHQQRKSLREQLLTGQVRMLIDP